MNFTKPSPTSNALNNSSQNNFPPWQTWTKKNPMHPYLSLVSFIVLAIVSDSKVVQGFSVSSTLQSSRPRPRNTSFSELTSARYLHKSIITRNDAFPRLRSMSLHESGPLCDDKTAESTREKQSSATCWNPTLRKQMATISILGMIETIYLSYDKLFSSDNSLMNSICSATGSSCSSVLNGPYASITLFDKDVPLSLFGVGAYTTAFILAGFPLIVFDDQSVPKDATNRIALLGVTTLMGTFSVYLVSLILGVLNTTCILCFVSAGLSVMLASMSWFGGVLPSFDEADADELSRDILVKLRKNGVITGVTSFGIATTAALTLFLSVDDSNLSLDSSYTASIASSNNVNSGTLVASTERIDFSKNIPPPITTKSSSQALTLANDLSSLHSKMYGAFWCSHCYDQKQSLGLQAMQSIPYVECDREGYNNQRDLCRAKEVPGYPTWEIDGELFPGERSLDELREIVDGVMSQRK